MTTPDAGQLATPASSSTKSRLQSTLLWLLLAACIFKLWILPLPSSLWVDEMVTAFVIHHGPDHPSLRIAPQVVATNYYALPKLAEQWFGFSEVAYRMPSVILMAIALFALARIAMRVIHPGAGWFVVFATFTLRGLNYEAADARPYALAIAMASLSALFLVRWLDDGKWLDAGLFVIFASLLWRAHLVVWPFYLVFALYAVVRVWRKDGKVGRGKLTIVALALAVGLLPVLLGALSVLREASKHVVTEKPSVREWFNTLKPGLVVGCGAGAWIVGGLALNGWQRNSAFRFRRIMPPSISALALIGGWWVLYPLGLYAFSWISGSSVFVPRYLSPALPGAALAATLAVSCFLPVRIWRAASLGLGAIALLAIGSRGATLAEHHNSRWREASAAVRQLQLSADTPVLYPSPFIEAEPPAWQPDLALPAFLYCHLEIYKTGGMPFLLPFRYGKESTGYAERLAVETLSRQSHFVLYGGDYAVDRWREFFKKQASLAGWRSASLGSFGDVDAVVFAAPGVPMAKNQDHLN